MPSRSEQVVITVMCSDDACASNWKSLFLTGQNEVYIYWDKQSDCVQSCDLNWDPGLSWGKKVLNGLFSHRNLTHSFCNKRGSADDMRYKAWDKEWHYTGSSTRTNNVQKLKRLNSHKIPHQTHYLNLTFSNLTVYQSNPTLSHLTPYKTHDNCLNIKWRYTYYAVTPKSNECFIEYISV